MKRALLYGIILFSLVFNVVFIVHLFGMKSSEKNSVSFLGEKLNLTAEQKEKIHTQCMPYRTQNDELENKLASKRAEILNLIKSKDIDMKKIEACIDEINSLQKKIQLNVVKQMIVYKSYMNESQCNFIINNLGEKMDIAHVCDENCSCKSN